MIELNDVVEDRITGFTGVVIGRTEWLYGCVRFGVQSEELKDGKPLEHQWFDEQQLARLVRPVGKPCLDCSLPKQYHSKGGPQDDPQRMNDPLRV